MHPSEQVAQKARGVTRAGDQRHTALYGKRGPDARFHTSCSTSHTRQCPPGREGRVCRAPGGRRARKENGRRHREEEALREKSPLRHAVRYKHHPLRRAEIRPTKRKSMHEGQVMWSSNGPAQGRCIMGHPGDQLLRHIQTL